MKKPVYFDYASTTPVHPHVVEKMLPYFTERYGNSGSSHHYYGWQAAEAIQTARKTIADYFSLAPSSILFTSGATESCNLAIQGYLQHRTIGHIITSSIEHKAVLAVFQALEQQGWDVTYLQPNDNGEISVDDFKTAIKPNTCFASLMWVNNELGTITDISTIKLVCSEHQIVLHVDATQALGKIIFPTDHLPDLMTISAHKVYGPKGIGALLCSSSIQVDALFFGGDQERAVRPGTLAVQQIVGFAACFDLLPAFLEKSDELLGYQQQIEVAIHGLGIINSHGANRVPHIIHFSVPDIDWEELYRLIPAIAVSNGSACNSKSHQPSHVLTAMGLDEQTALASIRVSMGYFTTQEDVDILINQCKAIRR